jgi:hypothetical protein
VQGGGIKYQPKKQNSKETGAKQENKKQQQQQAGAGTPLYKKKEKQSTVAEQGTTLKLPKDTQGDGGKKAGAGASDTTTATPSSNTPTESAPSATSAGVKFVRKEKAVKA